MRQTMLKIHNDLRRIKMTIEECNDLWLSDLRTMEDIIHDLHKEFEFSPKKEPGGYHYSDWIFSEDVKEEEEDES
tara:strand:+ start:81 stop:305 length:225 start_codon:yes stop_codon:yes gene_type:complete